MAPHFPGTSASRQTDWFDLLFRQISDGAVVFDAGSWRVLTANPATAAVFGMPVDDVSGSDLRDLLPTDTLIEIGQCLNALSDGELAKEPIRSLVSTADRATIDVTIRVSLKVEQRQRLGLLVIRRFKSETTEAAPARRASQNSMRDTAPEIGERAAKIETRSFSRLKAIIGRLNGFFWEYDAVRDCFTYVSPKVEALLGYPAERWLDEPGFFASIIHADDRASTLEFCRNQTAIGADHSMEYRMIDSGGAMHWIRDIVLVESSPDDRCRFLRGVMLDVTNDESVRDRLRLSEERYERIFNDSPAALWELDWSEIRASLDRLGDEGVTDLNRWFDENPLELQRLARLGKIVGVNRVTLEMYEADSVESFLEGLASIFREESLPAFQNHLVTRYAGAVHFETDNVTYTLSGQRMYSYVSVTAAPGCEQNWKRLYASLQNVTQRKHAELLRDGQRRVLERLASGAEVEDVLDVLVEEVERQSPFLRCVAFQISGSDGRLVRPVWKDAPEEVVTLLSGREVRELIPAQDATHESGVAFVVDDPDDSSRFPPAAPRTIGRAAAACGCLDSRVIVLNDHDGTGMGTLFIFRTEEAGFSSHERDVIISFRRLARLVLTHEKNRNALLVRTSELQSVFETCPDALLRVARDGTVLEQYSGEPICDVPAADVIGMRRKLWHLFSLEAADRIRKAMWLVDEGSPLESIEFTISRNGDDRSIEGRFVALGTSGEQIAILRDVSRLRRTEQALQNISERFKDLFDSSPDAIFVETLDGTILDVNPAACELHDLTHRELVGRRALDLVPSGEHEAVAGRVMPVMTGEISEFESKCLRSDGTVIPVNVRSTVIRYDGLPALLLHVRDITDRRRAEERRRDQERQMAHVSRLTMMGQLVAGIAHEIRQPLWSISTFADVASELLTLQDAAQRIEKLREIVSKVVSESRRANNITTRMLAFARNGQPERTEIALEGLIRNAVAIAAARARTSQVAIVLQVSSDLPSIVCDSVLIEQTIVNLLSNACRALEQKPTGRREIVLSAGQDGELVRIRVSDNGPGLPDGVAADQLFEGFFTTNHSGMGIGLALSRSFVEDHGGEIIAVTNPDGGMTFEFSIRIDGRADSDDE